MRISVLELRRKGFHVLFGGLLMLFLWFATDPLRTLALLGLLLIGLVLSMIERQRRIPVLSRALDLFERKQERKRIPGKGMLMLVAGTLLPVLLFSEQQRLLIITGLLVITLGDPIAHLVGKRFGRIMLPYNRRKSLEGRVVAFLVCYGIIFLLWKAVFVLELYPWWLSAAGVLAGMFIETLPLERIGIDDNLLIPTVVSVVIYTLA